MREQQREQQREQNGDQACNEDATKAFTPDQAAPLVIDLLPNHRNYGTTRFGFRWVHLRRWQKKPSCSQAERRVIPVPFDGEAGPHSKSLPGFDQELHVADIGAAIEWISKINVHHPAEPGAGAADSQAESDVS